MHSILSIDQGTTSSRAIVFDSTGKIEATAQQEFPQHYPENGWVEHNPEDLWQTTLEACRAVLQQTGKPLAAIGITNQRETTLIWHRKTGKPIYNAIVWQDRRTAELCASLKKHEPTVSAKTGLLLDPYFSATKIAWILDRVPEARTQAAKGELAFGTVDSFLLWRLTSGKVHATDATNASRTLLYNIHENRWDNDLLNLFNIPASLLPEVKDSAADYGATSPELFGTAIPISAIAGDQQAATIGQCCFEEGMVKSTYGTGCFMLLNTGAKSVSSSHRLLTTIAYRLKGRPTYALEGAVFNAGTVVKWLRDNLGLITHASETEAVAKSVPHTNGVYFVPAFTGLGAPHWSPHARGALYGLTRSTHKAEIVRAALESIAYQTHDLLFSMQQDASPPKALRVDGGMVKNNWLLQFLSDILNLQIDRPVINETTALGVAYLAALQQGLYSSLNDIAAHWQNETSFFPQIDNSSREFMINGWNHAVKTTLSY